MKIVAAVFADFESTFLGGRAALDVQLGSRSVLAHTLDRLMHVEGLDGRCLFVQPRDAERATGALRELQLGGRIDVLPLDDGLRPRRGLLRSARKWGLASWRGTLLGSTWFDEYVEPLCAGRVLDHYAAEGVLCLDAHMAALDPGIASAMIAHQRESGDDAKLVFTQAPPGLAGLLLRREVTREMLVQEFPVGLLLTYRPEIPAGDPINRPPCLQLDATVAHTAVRLSADTRRGRELLAAGFAALGENANAPRLCKFLHETALPEPLPAEIELELTTDDPLPNTKLRPRGARLPHRSLTDLDAVSRMALELAAYDDRLLFLGGHGDPLLHSAFPEVCRRIREAGVCGLGVATPLCELSEAALDALVACQVDVVQVRLDAATPETYQRVHGANRFEQVRANIQRIQQARVQHTSPQPLVVCSLMRCAATLAEQEGFFDDWIRQTGAVAIEGHNDYCRALPADSLLALTPPIRGACRRLGRRLIALADGAVPHCSQDFTGRTRLGYWTQQPLAQIWGSAALAELRAAHAASPVRLTDLTDCQRCGEWHRP